MKCPECNSKMGPAGGAWSGRSLLQKYRCHECGRTRTPTEGQVGFAIFIPKKLRTVIKTPNKEG